MKNKKGTGTMIDHLFARPDELLGAPFYIEGQRDYNPAGGYTEEFRRIDGLWHHTGEQPRPERRELLIWHRDAGHPWVTHAAYDPDFDWARYCEVFCVYRWAYVEDFLPCEETIKTTEEPC